MRKYSKVLAHFKKNDPKIYKYLKDVDFDEWFQGEKLTKEDDLFVRLCRTIVGQQLSGKAAGTIYGRFTKLFGRRKINPKNVLSFEDQELRDVGMSWGKVSYVKDLAKKVKNKEIHLEKLDLMDEDEIVIELTKVKGIGEWTAEMFLMFSLKREDVFSHGDLGLRKGIEKVYGIKKPSTIQIEKTIKKWQPFKTYGSIALWHAVDSEVS